MTRHDRIADELLVLRCQEADDAAFEQLVKRWQERLWRHAFRLTGNEDAAWDVLQETWTAINCDLRHLRDAAAFPGWAYRIASFKCRDWIRRQRRQRRADEAYSERQHELAQRETQQPLQSMELREILGQLPGSDRAILALRYQEDFSIDEIAEILQIPAGTVKSRLFHARRRLRQHLEKADDEPTR